MGGFGPAQGSVGPEALSLTQLSDVSATTGSGSTVPFQTSPTLITPVLNYDGSNRAESVLSTGEVIFGTASALSSSEFHLIRKDANGATWALLENRNDHAAARAYWAITAGGQFGTGSVPAGFLITYSPSWATSGLSIADAFHVTTNSLASGGLILEAGTSAPLIFGINNGQIGRVLSTGEWIFGTTTALVGSENALLQKNQNASTYLNIENTTDGTAALAGVRAGFNGGSMYLFGISASYTSAGVLQADSVSLSANTSKLCLGTGDAFNIEIYRNDTLTVTFTDTSVTLADGINIVTGTTTGMKIGTATTQKLGFYNATPVVQGASVADPTGGAVIDAEARTAIIALISRIEATGLIATV